MLITFGTFVFAIGIYFFKFRIIFPPAASVSLFCSVIFFRRSPQRVSWIINIILLIVGFIILGRGFGVLTVYCSMLLSF